LNDKLDLIDVIFIGLFDAPFDDLFEVGLAGVVLGVGDAVDDLDEELGELVVLGVLVFEVEAEEPGEDFGHALAHDFVSHGLGDVVFQNEVHLFDLVDDEVLELGVFDGEEQDLEILLGHGLELELLEQLDGVDEQFAAVEAHAFEPT